MEFEFTGSQLLDAAIEWYEANPGTQIPKSGVIGRKKINSELYFQTDSFSIESDDESNSSASHVQINVIPLIAGISLNLKPEDLALIIHAHAITSDQVTNLDFRNEWSKSIRVREEPDEFVSSARIGIELSKALYSDNKLREVLRKDISNYPCDNQILGSMHIDDDALWPATQIEHHSSIVMSDQNNPFKSFFKDFQGGLSLPRKVDELPHGKPYEAAIRSGMLTETVLRKQTGHFGMWEDVVFHAMYDSEPHILMLEHFAKTTDKEVQALAIRGLLSLSTDSTHHEFVAQCLYETIQKYFEYNEAFTPVFESIILKMNLFATSEYSPGLKVMSDRTMVFDEIRANQNTLLSRVAREIISRDGNNLGLSDFSVFKKLKSCKIEGHNISFSPEDLINKLVDSYSNFVSPASRKERDKFRADKEVTDGIGALISMLSHVHTFDYEQFTHRSDNEKVMLIENGMDMRSFKGLSRQARGRLLEIDLGM